MTALNLTLEGAAFIIRFELFKPTPYRCLAGKLTIGYGHVIRPDEYFEVVTKEQAMILLQKDATREASPVARALDVPLTTYQQDAVISLAFNCGGTAIARSTLVRRLNAGLITDAADEFLRWNKVKGTEVRGLKVRRKAERQLFLTGDYGA